MKYSEISIMTVAQLNEALAADQMKLGKLKFSHAVAPLANPQEIRNLRRHIARLQTAITSKSNQAAI